MHNFEAKYNKIIKTL